MPRSFTGDSVEEQELARLLDQVLRDLGMTTLQLTKVLRADQFTDGKIPAQATVYRYLRGEQLMRKGAELIDAILEQCTEERRKELRRQVREIIRRHEENPAQLPPPTPEEIEGKIKGLERDLEEAERERVAAQQGAAENISVIREALNAERARRAEAERTVDELQPLDPTVLAEDMATHLAEVRAAGDGERFRQVLSEFAAEEVPSEAQAALLGRLEREEQPVALELARMIGDRKYYRSVPDLVRLLDRYSAMESRRALLRVAGARFYGTHREWLLEVMSSEQEFGGARHDILAGIGEKGSVRDWFNARHLMSSDFQLKQSFLAATAGSRPIRPLWTIIDKVLASRVDYDRYASLFGYIGEYRKPIEVLAIIDELRLRGGRNREAAERVLRGVAEQREPETAAGFVGAAEFVTVLRRLHRNGDARKVVNWMGAYADFSPIDNRVATLILTMRARGWDADADQVVTVLVKHGNVGAFPPTVKALGRQSKAQAAAVLSYAAKRWWPRRWRLATALREKGMTGEAAKFRVGAASVLYRVAVVLGAVVLVIVASVPIGWVVLVECTPVFDSDDIDTVVSGDRPTVCGPPDCAAERTLTYQLAPGDRIRTEYRITSELRNLGVRFHVATPNGCPADRATVAYELVAGDERAAGELPAGEENRISFGTDGATSVMLVMRVANPVAGCDVTVTVIDPAMHRLAPSWLQLDE